MNRLFSDLRDALATTAEIVEKVEDYKLDSAPIMPVFPIPEEFGTEEDYKKKYSDEQLLEEFGDENISRLGGYEKVLRV